MSSQPRQNFTRLAVAIIIAGVAIGAGIFASSYVGTSRTVTETTMSQLYQVEFLQGSNCFYGSWLVPWAVVLNGQTAVQPSNATLPLSYEGTRYTGDSNYSAIWFSLPNGTYHYTVLPKNSLGDEQSGNLTINGNGAVIQVYSFSAPFGCSTTSK
jgi:hypothetical protein